MADVLLRKAPEPRPLIQRMREYHPPLGSRDGLRLDFNENTFECSPRVLEALGRVAASDLTRYPERESVERKVAASLGLQAEQVLLTNGVDEAIHVLVQTFLDRGDELLLPTPTYAMYEVYASATEGTVKTIPPAEDFRFPFDRLLNAITPRTRIIAIANPNSPTGSVAERGQILEILERAPHAIVLVDEAYFHFYGQTVLDLIGRIPNLVVARTFSKAYGLAGLRLGMLAAAVETQHWLRTVISPYSVNALALACLPAALEDQAYLDWYVGEVRQSRSEFTAAFTRLGLPQWPSAANFILVKIGDRHAEFVQAMRRRGVLTRDRSQDAGCQGCVRITVGTRAQSGQALRAIEESLEEIAWKRA
ncbi:MAG TPA: histidinol-phosphate transaminase [Acidobacteriaceae bacterium]|nr:histidinol-phosphate transaminase [Acidobacteriaceae bacterium]